MGDKRWRDRRKETAVAAAMADKNLEGWLMERRSGNERRWQEMAESGGEAMMAVADDDGDG
jgi:hypothetical protein